MLLSINKRLQQDHLVSTNIIPVSIACMELVDYVLNTEDPWIPPEYSGIQKCRGDKRKQKGLVRLFSSWARSTSPDVQPTLVNCISLTTIPPSLEKLHIMGLPPELLQYIMHYLDPQSLLSLGVCCCGCRDNVETFISAHLESFHRDSFLQRTQLRFDIPSGCNPWRRDRITRERDKNARMLSERFTKAISAQMTLERRFLEKQILMPVVGCRDPITQHVVQTLFDHAQTQLSTPPPSRSSPRFLTRTFSLTFPTPVPAIPASPLLSYGGDKDRFEEKVPTASDFFFTVETMHFRIVDISPYVSTFPKSVTHFQSCTGVVYCAPLKYIRPTLLDIAQPNSRRGSRLPPRCTRPRRIRHYESPLEQSLRQFQHFCSMRWFEEVPIVLLFTPSDEFASDLNEHDLRAVFPTYTGGNDYVRATNYLTQLFHAQNTNLYRKIYTYFIPHVTAPETTVVPILFNCVKNIVLERGLRYASIIL